VVSAMLYPYVYAYNEDNEEDKLAARVMRVLIENHLKKTKYEDKFLYMMCSALVNPAVFAR
jgi:Na+-transporting NADH:ubiquinone oxidoreductase subunit NqrF